MKKIFYLLVLLLLVNPVFSDLLDNENTIIEKEMRKYVTEQVVKNKFKGVYNDIVRANYGAGSSIYFLNIRRSACIRYLVENYKNKIIPDTLLDSLEKETQKAINELAEPKYIERVVTKTVTKPIYVPVGYPMDCMYEPMPSGKIDYGYNPIGEYVPVSVGGQRIKYGYNSYGEYVPISVGE